VTAPALTVPAESTPTEAERDYLDLIRAVTSDGDITPGDIIDLLAAISSPDREGALQTLLDGETRPRMRVGLEAGLAEIRAGGDS
jgi:hypothetical protein